MNSTLSVYLDADVTHDRQGDIDYIRALQSAWVRIHQVTARRLWQVQQAAPNAKILLRSWDIDDHNGDRKRELYANPKQAARDTINRWAEKVQELKAELERNGWEYRPNWYLGLWNEPDNEHIPQVVEGTAEAMRLAAQWGWRLGVGIPGVGRFPKPDEPGPNWSLFKPLERAIIDGGHILVVHEYWQPEGPDFVWTDDEGKRRIDAGNLAWRHRSIPLDVPILIGESGANGFIFNRHTQEDNGGWQRYMKPEQYAAQVKRYIEGCDSRVQGVCLFMTDFHSEQWWSFDTAPAHQQLLAIKDTRPSTSYPVVPKEPDKSVYVPVVGGPTPPSVEKPTMAQGKLIWPVKGVVTQRWGERASFYQEKLGIPYHNGLDIAAPEGERVVAIADGVIAWVDNDPPGYGNYVRVWHPAYRFHSFVAHLRDTAVQRGQVVKQGDVIGYVGSTGMSTGPHVHFEIRLGTENSYAPGTYGHKNGRVDPQTVYALLGV